MTGTPNSESSAHAQELSRPRIPQKKLIETRRWKKKLRFEFSNSPVAEKNESFSMLLQEVEEQEISSGCVQRRLFSSKAESMNDNNEADWEQGFPKTMTSFPCSQSIHPFTDKRTFEAPGSSMQKLSRQNDHFLQLDSVHCQQNSGFPCENTPIWKPSLAVNHPRKRKQISSKLSDSNVQANSMLNSFRNEMCDTEEASAFHRENYSLFSSEQFIEYSSSSPKSCNVFSPMYSKEVQNSIDPHCLSSSHISFASSKLIRDNSEEAQIQEMMRSLPEDSLYGSSVHFLCSLDWLPAAILPPATPLLPSLTKVLDASYASEKAGQ